MIVPPPQNGHRRGSVCNGISVTPARTCFRPLAAGQREPRLAPRLAVYRPPPRSIARLAFTLLVNQYRTKKEYSFPPLSVRSLAQTCKIGRFRTEYRGALQKLNKSDPCSAVNRNSNQAVGPQPLCPTPSRSFLDRSGQRSLAHIQHIP